MGTIGCTSFFPSKNLGCYGDGGALFTHDAALAERIKMVANHGQRVKYKHDLVGINSRLDTLQAGILNVKLKYLDEYSAHRNMVAAFYDKNLSGIPGLQVPHRAGNSTHVYHQYTIQVAEGRDAFKAYLEEKGYSYNDLLSDSVAFTGGLPAGRFRSGVVYHNRAAL